MTEREEKTMANILKETVRGVEAVRIEDELLKNREIDRKSVV